MNTQKRIGIFGVGAIGTVLTFGIKDFHDLYFHNRSPKEIIKLDFNHKSFHKQIPLEDAERAIIKYDWLIVCIKEYQTNSAIPMIRKLLSSQTKLVIMRNGLHLKDPFESFVDGDRILECVIDCPSEQINSTYYNQLRLGTVYTTLSTLATEFSNIFNEEHLVVKAVDDFHSFKWKKLIESSAIGAVLTVYGDTCKVFKDEEKVDLFKQLLLEGIKVAISDGAKIEDKFYAEQIIKLKSFPDNKGSSMLMDSINGRPLEWKAKNGMISKIGKQNQIKTEMNDLICAQLKQINIQ